MSVLFNARSGHPIILRISMKPYRSVLSEATTRSGVLALIFGVYKKNGFAYTLLKCGYRKYSQYRKFIDVLENMPQVKDIKILEKKARCCSLILIKDFCDFYDKIMSKKILVLTPYIMSKGLRKFIAVVPERSELDTFNKMLEEHGRVIDKERLSFEQAISYLEKNVVLVDLNSMLTPKQLEILDLAYRCGYYDWPRKIKLDEISKLMNISKTTVCEHLRRAELKILKFILKGKV